MSDTPAEPTRDPESGRYVRRHSADDKAAADAGSADSGETTDVPPPPPPTDGGDDDKDDKNGKKRWLLLLLLLLILLLLVCAGFAYNRWWGKPGPDPIAATPTAAATATARPSPSPSVTASPTPSPSPTATVKTINMPNVVGMPAADAKVILDGAGFTNIKFINEGKDGEELKVLVSFTATKQSAAAGTAIPADTALVITCKTTSNGKG
ncbi:PASTA domain-containing protein [Allorhizocola rhizosphaerae]|uniref:PASTA domain-containing protein n=1 Tax=Allorhizocola rhizosphaerae TaxID=1872709 RepID=UPI000E3E16DA|nr:PASTA domain-containing protein [Allorhizocola rhizosphaerae]